jgi:hypothetical protein
MLKVIVVSNPVLIMPDPDKPFIIASDASEHSGSAVLIQADVEGKRHPVAYFSRKWSQSEMKWATRDKECRAALDAITHWSTWVKRSYFTLESDHHSLQHLRTQRHLLPRQERLLDVLADYNFDVFYVAGPKNAGPDGLSRLAERLETPGSTTNANGSLNTLSSTALLGTSLLQDIASSYANYPFFNRLQKQLIASTHRNDNTLTTNSFRWTSDQRGLLWHYDVVGRPARLAVPDPKHQLILLKEAHDSRLTNHQAAQATLSILQKGYFWFRMQLTVDKYVRSCQLCQRERVTTPLKSGLMQPLPTPNRKWHTVGMDFVTKLVPTARGFDAIYTVVDYLTKRVRFIPTRNDATAEETALLFFNHIVCQFGLPKTIVSDRDAKFTSSFWTHLMATVGTNLQMSTVDHPQTDGQAEAMHRTLNARLRTMISHAQNDWDMLLPYIEFQMNSAPNESTGYAPFELDTGTLPRSPLSALIDNDITPDKNPTNQDHLSSAQFVKNIKLQLQVAQDNILLAKDHQQQQANKHRKEVIFQVGDEVMVEAEVLRSHSAQALRPKSKLALIYDGPFKIIDVINSNAYRLNIPTWMGVHNVINISKLKKFYPNQFAGRVNVAPQPVQSSTGEERYVQAILDHKKARGRIRRDGIPRWRYLVHWQGERADEATWEPEDNFKDENDNITTQALTAYLSKLHQDEEGESVTTVV